MGNIQKEIQAFEESRRKDKLARELEVNSNNNLGKSSKNSVSRNLNDNKEKKNSKGRIRDLGATAGSVIESSKKNGKGSKKSKERI